MKRLLILIAFLIAPSISNASDPRYTLIEYTMNNCPACVASKQDVAEIQRAGAFVEVHNTDLEPAYAEQARRFKLLLRPAWRLTTANGEEVARWYGSGNARVIVATIRTKFPTPPNKEPLEAEIPVEQESDDAEPTKPAPSIASPPLDLSLNRLDAQINANLTNFDALLGTSDAQLTYVVDDFRDRKPVVDRFQDAGFLDDSLDEWNRRNRNDGANDEGGFLFQRRIDPITPEQIAPSDSRLGERLAERIKNDALDRLDRIGEEVKQAILEKIVSLARQAFFAFCVIVGAVFAIVYFARSYEVTKALK